MGFLHESASRLTNSEKAGVLFCQLFFQPRRHSTVLREEFFLNLQVGFQKTCSYLSATSLQLRKESANQKPNGQICALSVLKSSA